MLPAKEEMPIKYRNLGLLINLIGTSLTGNFYAWVAKHKRSVWIRFSISLF